MERAKKKNFFFFVSQQHVVSTVEEFIKMTSAPQYQPIETNKRNGKPNEH